MQSPRNVLLLFALTAGLIFDPLGLLRMTLACSLLHELGHLLVYQVVAKKRPKLRWSIGGICLRRCGHLSRTQELAVLAAGPAVNLVMAAVLYAAAYSRPRYETYFLACVSLCIGCYNLLPLPVLDGGRIWQALVSAKYAHHVLRLQEVLLGCFCVGCLAVPQLLQLPRPARMAAAIASVYLAVQEWTGEGKY